MAILSSENFTVLPGARVKTVRKWFDRTIKQVTRNEAVVISVKIETKKRERQKKRVLKGAIGEECRSVKDGYEFDFTELLFRWNNAEIYLTAGEIVYLHKRLVLREEVKNGRCFLHNIRRRLGKGFLREVTG